MVAHIPFREQRHCISSGRSTIRKQAKVSEEQRKAQTSGPEMRRLTAKAMKFRKTAGNYTANDLVEMANAAVQEDRIKVKRYDTYGVLYSEDSSVLGD